MNAEQHFRGLQYLHRTLAIGTVTGFVSIYARLLAAGPPNELHKFSGLSIYCCLLCIVRIKFYLDDENHFQVLVDKAKNTQAVLEIGDLIDAIFSCLSWIAFLATVALLQNATLSRDAVLVAMLSSLCWVCAAIYRDKGKNLKFHLVILIANLIYMALFYLMNLANPSWPGQHATDLRGYLIQEKWTLLAFLVCFIDWGLTYIDQDDGKPTETAPEAVAPQVESAPSASQLATPKTK